MTRVYLSLVNNEQYRKKCVVDSIPWPQLHKGFNDFWKLYLNMCFLKWLIPRRSRVTSVKLCAELAASFTSWRIFFLNVRKLSEFRRLGFNLFHSDIVDRKKGFLRQICFGLKMGRLCTFLVPYGARPTGIKWKRYSECWFLKKTRFCKEDKVTCTNVEAWEILKLILDIIFQSIYP